jgi:hypothetical protein
VLPAVAMAKISMRLVPDQEERRVPKTARRRLGQCARRPGVRAAHRLRWAERTDERGDNAGGGKPRSKTSSSDMCYRRGRFGTRRRGRCLDDFRLLRHRSFSRRRDPVTRPWRVAGHKHRASDRG